MAKSPDLGKPARLNYAKVEFRHIQTKADERKMLTADPWSYLHSYLRDKAEASRGTNRQCFTRANYYANLAEDFYKAASGASLPTKGTLSYYGMLNLVKAFVSVRGVELETTQEHHGLSLPHGEQHKVSIQHRPKSGKSIFYEFARELGSPTTRTSTIGVIDACLNIPELHSICHELGFAGSQKQRFIPVEIDVRTSDDHKWLFTLLSYRKEDEKRTPIHRILKGNRKDYFLDPVSENGRVYHRSKKRKKLSSENWNRVYCNILKEYHSFSISSLLTPSGYKYYLNLRDADFHHLAYSLIAMFYAGTVARYRPSEVEVIMKGTQRAILTEAIALLPSQFLYQLTSLITERICVIPYSKI
ncbi:YaaC family protein [Pelagicoccus mobilis]|uniref:Uncharacterized protein n=1 Tax=Pelagicoccus mobilis TaxID=415221 RepID=A0A934RXZ0_9BACT|nr:YaaC family protein [Pelagicoccus mobilis]MBK1875598.1 hypothetical protein [Pelagicoccus mobilis]